MVMMVCCCRKPHDTWGWTSNQHEQVKMTEGQIPYCHSSWNSLITNWPSSVTKHFSHRHWWRLKTDSSSSSSTDLSSSTAVDDWPTWTYSFQLFLSLTCFAACCISLPVWCRSSFRLSTHLLLCLSSLLLRTTDVANAFAGNLDLSNIHSLKQTSSPITRNRISTASDCE